MAIGARITSNNLSGKTATVTFVPYTGTTSGSTENLGTQTIPFNNITNHPYGLYSLYFAEYDYTYTLRIPEPVVSVQSYAICTPLSGSTNYGVGFLNFDDLTATVLDLNVDSNVWSINDQYPIQDKGFVYHFHLNNDWNSRMVVYTDTTNNVIGTYSGVTSDWNYDIMDGVWAITWDWDGGVAYYSNGEDVYTYNWDPNRYQFDFDWNNYAVKKDGSFIIILYDTQTGTKTSYNVSYHNEITEIETWDSNQFNKYYCQAPTHTFVPAVTWDDNNNLYDNIKFFDSTGLQIGSTIDLTNNTYDNYSWEQYGMNRFVIVFWNNGDVEIPYRIIHFDGETNNVIDTYKTRGYNYESLYMEADDNVWSNDEPATCMYMVFSHITNWNYMMYVDYCDIVYMLGSETSLTTYEFANNSNKGLITERPYSRINIPFFDEENVVKILSFNNSGPQIVTTDITTNGSDKDYWTYTLNDLGFVAVVWNTDYTTGNIVHTLTPGVLSNNLPISLQSNWQFRINATNNIFVFDDYTNITYINTTSNGFVTLSGETYNRDYYSSTFYSTGHTVNDMMLLVNDSNGDTRLITGTNITGVFRLPDNNGSWNIEMGKDHIMYTYGDINTNQVKVALYDRTMSLVNSLTTNYSNGWNSTYGVKDRYVLTINDNGNLIAHMITPTTTNSIIMSDSNYYDTVNDFQYWAD